MNLFGILAFRYVLYFLYFQIVSSLFCFLLRLIIHFIDILLSCLFHFPNFVFYLELDELKLHLLERSMGHDDHVDNNIEGSNTDHRPANI